MNVVIITLDTTRADHIGCYGNKDALTPALDELAADGIVFERAYATAPLTLPSHASIFSGLYPPEHGLYTNGKNSLGTDVPTLAEILLKHGYDTGAFIASFVLDRKFGLNRGFQTYGDDLTGTAPQDEALHRNRDGNLVVDEALAWLKGRSNRPFLCWIHLYDPHAPYQDHKQIFGTGFKDRPYDAEIGFVDLQIKRVLDFLKNDQLNKKTLVIVVGDHGEGLNDHLERRHGQMLYNSTMHVPLIISLPGKLPAGRRVATPVSQVDLFPTILECLRLRQTNRISGRSLVASARGERSEPYGCYGQSDEASIEAGCSPLRSLTTEPWKYIRTTTPELYNMLTDSAEAINLAVDHPEVIDALEQQLAEMESRMQKRQGIAVQLSQSEQDRLKSLGYVGGVQGKDGLPAGTILPDIKDMIPHLNALEDARSLMDAKKFDEAEKTLKTIVAAVPEYEMAQISLGDIHLKQGQFDEADTVYREILKRNPDCSLAELHLGDINDAQGKYADALKHYQAALQREADSAKLQYNTGRALCRLNRGPEAIPYFEAALQLDPGYVFAHIELGTVLFQLGKADAALEHYLTALKYDDDSLQAHMNSAMVFASRDQLTAALPHLKRATQINPLDPQIHYYLATSLITLGDKERAIAHLSEAVRLQPDFELARDLLNKLKR